MTRPRDLFERVFPFFDRCPLRSPKKHDLTRFCEISELVQAGQHVSAKGIAAVLEMRGPMNRGGKRRHSEEMILATLREWESSEAIRKAPPVKPGG